MLNADTSPFGLAAEHRDTEAALTESGVPHVVPRNGWYSEIRTSTSQVGGETVLRPIVGPDPGVRVWLGTYAAVKGTVEVLTVHLAKDLGRYGIVVNAGAPSAIQANLSGGAVQDTPAFDEFFARVTALGRSVWRTMSVR